ncbi:MAG: hypothetical protein KA715_01400 [Xanthomonadaceae bacterium]|nr:hypothetical protein [Xanthomonadaceae bacterium]
MLRGIKASDQIKQRISLFVKTALSLFGHLIILVPSTGIPQSDFEADEKTKESIRGMELPEIEARQFEVVVIRASSSGRVFLMDDRNQSKPRVGKVLLLKKNILSPPSMAVRVIRIYENKNQFAAKRVKRYGNTDTLDPANTLVAIEKIAELKPYQTVEDEELKDEAELDELEHPEVKEAIATAEQTKKEIQQTNQKYRHNFSKDLPNTKKFDSVLDAEATKDELADLEDSSDETDGLIAKNKDILDPDRHLIGMDFASVINVNELGKSMFYSAASFRYGLTLVRRAFFLGKNFQDSLTIEGTVYYYKAYNLDGNLDAYTLLPFSGILRENFHVSDSLAFFIYGGILYNNVIANIGGSDTTIAALGGLKIAAGGGILMKIGPRWNIRMNGGIDSICVGLALRF